MADGEKRMKIELWAVGMIGLVIFAISVMIFGTIIFFDVSTSFDSLEEITVVGEATNVEVFDDYFIVTFNNNSDETYKLNYPGGWRSKALDFTVNSKLIIKLTRITEDGILLKFKDDAWDVTSIVKVPDGT